MVRRRSRGSGLVAVAALLARSLAFQAPLQHQLARSHAQRITARAAAPGPPAAPAPADRRIQLAKAFVVDDFGRANPDLLQDDFAFELGSSLLTKERYLRSEDLSLLRAACGDTLRVGASDFRIDPGDDEAVLFTLVVSGIQSKPYKGLEDRDALKSSGPWKTLPTCGRCAFDASSKCYAATLGAPLDRDDRSRGVETLTDACWVAMGGKLGGLNIGLALSELVTRRTPATPRGVPATEPLIDAADAVGVADAALRELLLRPEGAPLPEKVASALFAEDCVVLGEGFAAMPLRNAAKQRPWGDGSFAGASFRNYRVGADDARRILCDVVLPDGRLEGASVHVDEDEKIFRCSVGWVIREGTATNPLAELQKAALPLDRAIDAAIETYEQLDKTVLQPSAEFLDNTVLSFDASRAAVGAALAEADQGVTTARAELDKALAAAEASYETLAAGPKALAADAEKAVAEATYELDKAAAELQKTADEADAQLQTTLNEANRTLLAFLEDPATVLQSGVPKSNASAVQPPKRDAPQKPAPVDDPAEDLKRAEARLAAAETAAAKVKASSEAASEAARKAAEQKKALVVEALDKPAPAPVQEPRGAIAVATVETEVFQDAPDTLGARMIAAIPRPPPEEMKPEPAFELPDLSDFSPPNFELPKPAAQPVAKPAAQKPAPRPASKPAPRPAPEPQPKAAPVPKLAVSRPSPRPVQKPPAPFSFGGPRPAQKPVTPAPKLAPKPAFSFGGPPKAAPRPTPRPVSKPAAPSFSFGPRPAPKPTPKAPTPAPKPAFSFGGPRPAPRPVSAPAPTPAPKPSGGFSLFGSKPAAEPVAKPATPAPKPSGGFFGIKPAAKPAAPAPAPKPSGGFFGSKPASKPAAKPAAPAPAPKPTGGGFFGSKPASKPAAPATPAPKPSGGFFGGGSKPASAPAPAPAKKDASSFGGFFGSGSSPKPSAPSPPPARAAKPPPSGGGAPATLQKAAAEARAKSDAKQKAAADARKRQAQERRSR